MTGTASVCPVCLQVIPAEVVVVAGRVRLRKRCAEHGAFEADHLWQLSEIHDRLRAFLPGAALPPSGLVVNVTNACNLRCPYCYSRANEVQCPKLGVAEIEALVAGFTGRVVYLSGGEPTLHEDLCAAISMLRARGFTVGLFSNGLRLQDERFVARLRNAGLGFVILQFDTLRDDRYEALRGRSLLDAKGRALDALRAQGLPAYLFVMLVDGLNEDEVGALLDFAAANHDVVKILNFNPVWEMGRSTPGRLTPAAIARLVAERLEIGVEEILQATECAFHVSQLISSLQGVPAGQPCCELRCYGVVERGRLMPLSRLIDLPRVNELLRQVLCPPVSRGRVLLRLARRLPRLASLGLGALLAGDERAALARLLAGGMGPLLGASSLEGSPLLSVIIGAFHTAENIDLGFQRTCNLYSHIDVGGEQRLLPACTRQIIVDRAQREPALDVGAVVRGVQRALAGEETPT